MSSHLQPFNRKSITANKSFTNQNLFILLKHSQNTQIKSIFSLFLSQLYTLVDQDNQTILHVAANNNNYEMISYFIQEQKRLMNMEKDQDQVIKNRNIWMNRKNNDGFTCLHYAVFRNNYKLVTLLELNGADIHEVNSQGLSVLHIAAQANSPLLIDYFIHQGIPIQKVDKKGNTALHWACYSSAQQSTYALIGWGADLNKKQHTFGMTPLQMSVISGNSKIVKKLLIKGCQRNIQCSNGKYPIDMANENQYMHISQMIKDKRTCADIINFKTPYHKPAKISFQFFQFLFLFLSTYLLNIALFILTTIYESNIHHQYTHIISILQIIFIVFCVLTLILFVVVFASNPGKLTTKDKNNKQLFYHLQRVPANNICFDCSIVKPERSKHCQICQSCISVYDHHCPWIGNCIGVDNFYLFYLFLLLLLFSLCSGMILSVYSILYIYVDIVVIDWMKEIYWYHIVQLVVAIYTLVITAIFIIPVIILLVRQTKNSLYNRTSYQYYTNKQNNPRMPTVTPSSSIAQISDNINNNKAEKHNKSQLSQALNSQFAESHTVQHNISFKIDQFSLKQIKNIKDNNNNVLNEGNNKNIQLNQLIQTTKTTNYKVPQIRKQNYRHNCYMFCVGNRNIVKYRNAI